MSFGRTATFIDIYIERDLKAGKLTETEAQELVDHLVMKLRMVRFLSGNTRNTIRSLSGDPMWATETIAGMGLRRPYISNQKYLPYFTHPLQHGYFSRTKLNHSLV